MAGDRLPPGPIAGAAGERLTSEEAAAAEGLPRLLPDRSPAARIVRHPLLRSESARAPADRNHRQPQGRQGGGAPPAQAQDQRGLPAMAGPRQPPRSRPGGPSEAGGRQERLSGACGRSCCGCSGACASGGSRPDDAPARLPARHLQAAPLAAAAPLLPVYSDLLRICPPRHSQARPLARRRCSPRAGCIRCQPFHPGGLDLP